MLVGDDDNDDDDDDDDDDDICDHMMMMLMIVMAHADDTTRDMIYPKFSTQRVQIFVLVFLKSSQVFSTNSLMHNNFSVSRLEVGLLERLSIANLSDNLNTNSCITITNFVSASFVQQCNRKVISKCLKNLCEKLFTLLSPCARLLPTTRPTRHTYILRAAGPRCK